MLCTVIGAFILYFISGPNEMFSLINGMSFSTYYINLSIFLAFAMNYPDMEVLLYFIIPIKMKWMGLVYGVMILYGIISGSMVTRIAIIASILNFIIFFLSTRQFEQVFTERTGPQGKVQTAVGASYDICQRSKTSLCGMRTDGTGWSVSWISVLLKM